MVVSLNRYSKGARNERELLGRLHAKGYSVMRGAGSGVNSLSPDILAIKDKEGFAFECKAWDRTSLTIDPEQFEHLVAWKANTGMRTFIAWRMNGIDWIFLDLEEMRKAEKSYTITRSTALGIGRKFEHVFGEEVEEAEEAEGVTAAAAPAAINTEEEESVL